MPRLTWRRWEESSVSLVFETRAEGRIDRGRTLAAWAHPEVWRPASKPSPPNVIFVSLDTLRADRLSLYGNPRPTSPQLDRWARAHGVVFEKAVAPSPWTLPSHASMFTGLDALRHGVNHGYPVPPSLKVMADLFRRAGYATAAVTGGAYVSAEYGFDRGFDSFYAHRGWGDDEEMQAGVDRALAWLQHRDGQPFLLFLHTYAIHAPYRARQPYFTNLTGTAPPSALYLPESVPPAHEDGFQVRLRLVKQGRPMEPSDLAVLSGLYDSSIAYADAQLGRLFSALEARGLDRRTIVVVTSDHGEALGERGLASHAYLYDFNLLVPLVVAAPDGRGAGRRVSCPGPERRYPAHPPRARGTAGPAGDRRRLAGSPHRREDGDARTRGLELRGLDELRAVPAGVEPAEVRLQRHRLVARLRNRGGVRARHRPSGGARPGIAR